jgi:hypothetical protein
VSECDHESWTTRRPWPTRAVAPWNKKRQQRVESFVRFDKGFTTITTTTTTKTTTTTNTKIDIKFEIEMG